MRSLICRFSSVLNAVGITFICLLAQASASAQSASAAQAGIPVAASTAAATTAQTHASSGVRTDGAPSPASTPVLSGVHAASGPGADLTCATLKTCDEAARTVFALGWRLLVLLGVIAAAWIIYREWLRSPVIIEPFDVPKDLNESGLSGAVISQQIADRIHALQQSARTDDGAAEQALVEIPRMQVDLQLPGTPWSIGNAVRYLKQSMRKRERRLAGDVLPKGKAHVIRIRSADGEARDVPVHVRDPVDVSRALDDAAEAILGMVKPLELAAICYSKESPDSGFAKTRRAVGLHLSTKRHVGHQASYVLLATVARDMGDTAEMEDCLLRARLVGIHGWRRYVLGNTGPRYLNFRGGVEREAGHPDEAIRYYRRALYLAPNDMGIRSNLGLAYIDCNRFGMAGRFFRSVLSLGPNSSRGWRGLGLIEARRNNTRLAITFFTRALDVAPLARWARLNRMDVYRRIGELTRADADLETLLKIDPRFAPMYRLWCPLLVDRWDLAAALEKITLARQLAPTDVWNDVELARLQRVMGQPAEAILSVNRALARRPDFPDALRVLAAARLQMGDFEGAERALKKAVQTSPWDVWAALELSDLLRDQGRMAEASGAVQEAFRRRPDFTDVLRRQAKLLVAAGDLSAAERVLRRAIDLSPNDIWSSLDLSDLLRDAGRWDEAKKVIERALAAGVRQADVLRRWALLLAKRGETDAAEKKYREAMEISPADDVSAPLELAAFLQQAGRSSEAMALVERAHQRQPRSPHVLRRWAGYLAKQGDMRGAEDRYRQAIDAAPADIWGLLDLAGLLQQNDRKPDALIAITRAYERAPGSADVLRRWAAWLAKQGDVDGAIDKYRQAIDIARGDIHGLLDLARLLEQAGRLPDAQAAAKAAHERRPLAAEPLRLWAWLLMKDGQRDLAEEKFRQAVELSPADEILALMDLAGYLQWAGRLPEAIEVVERARRCQPRSPDPLRRLAAYRAQQGDRDGAVQLYRQAIDVAPADVWSLLDLANLLTQAGRQTEAFDAIMRAHERDPRSAHVLRRWAAYLARQGDTNGAEARYREAIDVAPADVWGLLDLSDLLLQMGRGPEALAAIVRAHGRDPRSADVLRRWGGYLTQHGDRSAAEIRYRQAFAVSPDDIGSLRDLANLLQYTGRLPEALTLMQQADARRPRSPDILRLWAWLLAKHRQPELAEEKYREAVEQSAGDDIQAHLDLAAFLQNARLPEATQIIEQAHQLQPRSPVPLRRWAALLAKRDDITGAEARYREAIDASPTDIWGLLDLASLLMSLPSDRKQDALAAIMRAHERDPRSPYVLRHWASYLARVPDIQAAERKYREAIALAPADPLGLLDLAMLQLRDKRPQEALEAAREASERHPGSPEYLRIWAQLLAKNEQPDMAEAKYRQAIEQSAADDIRALIEFAGFLQQAKKLPEAIVVIERAHERQPESEDVLRRWAALLDQQGKHAEARDKRFRADEIVLGHVIKAAELPDVDFDGDDDDDFGPKAGVQTPPAADPPQPVTAVKIVKPSDSLLRRLMNVVFSRPRTEPGDE